MAKYCLKLEDKKLSFKEAGNKAYALSKISDTVLIPRGVCITTRAFNSFIEKNNIEEVIDEAIDKFLNHKISVQEASSQIKNAFKHGKSDESIKNEIYDHLSNLKYPFAVRSSSTAEDSENLSFAGLFDSYLYVNTKEIEEKIKDVYASLFNERVIMYAYRNGVDLRNIMMGVIVQEMVRGDKFGVGFYFEEDEDEIFIIESVIGDPLGVTAGGSVPDTYIIKNEEIVKYPKKININSLFDFEIKEITLLMRKLKNEIFPLDIEWGLGEGKLLILQIRPLTRKIPISKEKQLLAGLPASPGRVCGKAVIWDKKREKELVKGRNKILIAEEIEIEDVEIIKNFGGAVLEVSGITAHAAILSREIGIPCIVGVNEITKLIKPREKICIDGEVGKITFLERENFSIERKYKPIYVTPKNLRYFKWKRDMVLYLPEKNYAIVYHAGLKDELREVIHELRKKVKIPLVDGGVDVWYGYGMILEMSQLNEDVYQDFSNALKSVESLSIQTILETINEYVNKAMKFYTSAEKDFNAYLKTKDIKYLYNTLQNIDFAYAYWKMIGHCILYDYAENIISSKEDVSSKEFLKFIIEMEQDKKIQRVGDRVVDLVGKILDSVKKDLNIDYSLYTSEIAILSKIVQGGN
jgi:phosphohistidine swiveling domain-containing protein